MPSIRTPAIRHVDALLGGAWVWDDDDDEHEARGASASPQSGEPEHEEAATGR